MAALLLTTCLIAYTAVLRNWFFATTFLAVCWISLTAILVRSIERLSRELADFIRSVRSGGYSSQSLAIPKGQEFASLTAALDELLQSYQQVDTARETHFRKLLLLTEFLPVGVLTFNSSNEVESANPAFLRLVGAKDRLNSSQLSTMHPHLWTTMTRLHSGEQTVIKFSIATGERRIFVQVQDFIVDTQSARLVITQDLQETLDAHEIESWQRLTRVLTHEIMNSVTPVVSLSSSLTQLVKPYAETPTQLSNLEAEDLDELIKGIQTIEARARGLKNFVSAYKSFTQTPVLHIAPSSLAALVGRVITLFKSEFDTRAIAPDLLVPEELTIMADAEWIEQVLINLIQNAIDASSGDNDKIVFRASAREKTVILEISDNGKGMDTETLEKAFIPFFTTKRKGTGVGLSFSRQIMNLHRGGIQLTSSPGEGTHVVLEFPSTQSINFAQNTTP